VHRPVSRGLVSGLCAIAGLGRGEQFEGWAAVRRGDLIVKWVAVERSGKFRWAAGTVLVKDYPKAVSSGRCDSRLAWLRSRHPWICWRRGAGKRLAMVDPSSSACTNISD